MTRSSTAQYTYNTQPHSAPRPGLADSVPLTMMSDPRVVRGNTFSLARKIAKDRTERPTESDQQYKAPAAEQPREAPRAPTYSFASRPFALDGTDLTRFLVDQSEREVVPTRLCETQTDAFTAQAPPAAYVPRKSGVDRQTQVDDVGELFNFDEESAPLVEVIVRKTLEQALVEVNHEAELAELQQQMEAFEAQRHQELQWMKQQEDSVVQDYLQVRGVVEKMQQQLKRSREVKTKVAGLQMARQILPHCLQRLTGAWPSPEEQDAVANVVPSVVEAAASATRAYNESSAVADGKCRRAAVAVAVAVARLTATVSQNCWRAPWRPSTPPGPRRGRTAP